MLRTRVGPLGEKHGTLIFDSEGRAFFRVYDKKIKSYIDYIILHSDLEVTIHGYDAFIYDIGTELVIDHTPATLGLKDES